MSVDSSLRLDHLQPTVEDYVTSDTDTDDDDDGGAGSGGYDGPIVEPVRPPANVGTKRSSDRTIVEKNKYATSDSGYSSLTTTTASSSKSKTSKGSQHHTVNPLRQVANALRRSSKKDAVATAPDLPPPRPSTATGTAGAAKRVGKRRDVQDLRLRSVESRDEAARMRLDGRSAAHIITERSPVYTPSDMPGAFPTSPVRAGFGSASNAIPVSRPPPRTRASSTTYQRVRPVSFTGPGSLPTADMYPTYTQAPLQQVPQSQPVQQAPVQQAPRVIQYEYPAGPSAPPPQQQLYVSTAAYPVSTDYATQAAYMTTPSTGTPGGSAAFSYTPTSAQSYYPPQQQLWPMQPDPYAYSAPPEPQPPPPPSSRRVSMVGMPDYSQYEMRYAQIHYEDTHPQYADALVQRRYSRTAAPTHSPYIPPPPPPPAPQVDNDVFYPEMEEYYRNSDRYKMPPPAVPQRPVLHARTTSHIPQTHRLSRSSADYQIEAYARKPSLEGNSRPPSRPGMPNQRFSSSSGYGAPLQHSQTEPTSPMRRRHAPSYPGQGDYREQMAVETAEEYQDKRSGGSRNHMSINDIPVTRRRNTKSSDNGSRGSSSRGEGTDSKHIKRLSRHSLDKQRVADKYYDRDGLTLNIGHNAAGNLTIKHSKDGEGMSLSFSGTSGAEGSRPPSRSTKSGRESSRIRSGGSRRYIDAGPSAGTSSGGLKSRDKGIAAEELRQRRSSSVQANVGEPDELVKSVRRLKLEDSHKGASRSSSTSAKHRR